MRRVKRIPVHRIALAVLTVGLGLVPDASVPVAARATPRPESRQQQLLNSYATADVLGQSRGAAPIGPSRGARISAIDRLPIDFVENRGQWPGPARFAARKGSMAAAFEPHAIRLHLGTTDATPLALLFEGASRDGALVGETRRSGVYNYFLGDDPSKWRSGVPAFAGVLYRGMYDGVDVRVREAAGRLEYDLLVAPGADLSQVVIRAEGATHLEIAPDGRLLLHTADGPLVQTPPATVEMLPDGSSRPIESRFRILDEHRYGFEAQARDPARPLVIDPGLVWSTFTGGTGGETLAGIEMARDGSGDIFLSGISSSPDFSAIPISQNTSRQHSFVARVAAAGNALVYLTFISGLAGQTFAGDMAGDATGGVVLVGTTADRDLPTTAGAFQRTNATSNISTLDGDGFVTRLDSAGAIVFSTYLGGGLNDGASDVRFDPAGSIVVAGITSSPDFPTTAGAYDTAFNTPPSGDNTAYPQDMFLARLSADGTRLTYSTFFGGQTYEDPHDMVVDSNGVVTVVGVTTSSATGRNIPITPGAYDATWNGSDDGFIARFKLDGLGGADLKYSTFLGGVNRESLDSVALDPTNPELVTVAGWSWVDLFTGPRFPTTAGSMKPTLTPVPPATPVFPQVLTGFVTRFRFPATGGGSLLWSTFVGGNFNDIATDVAVDETGAAIVMGSTRSYDLTTTRGAFDRTYAGASGGAHDCFVQRISATGSQLLYSTFLGGRNEDCDQSGFTAGRLVYLGGGTVAVAGMTDSSDFPTTAGSIRPAIDEATNGRNLFVATLRLSPDASGDLTADPPTLISPPNAGATDYGSITRFRWSDVADPSGVEAYVLEVSTKPDFPADFTPYRVSTSSSEQILDGLATTIPWYWRVRTADGAGNLSAWSTTSTFTTGVAGSLPALSMVQIYPTAVVGGASPIGVLHLTKPAPAGGIDVTLTAKDGRGFTQTSVPLTLPRTITVPAGAISANIIPLSTAAVSMATPVTIYATIAGIGAQGTISVNPPGGVKPSSLSLNPLTVTGGNTVTGTVTLTGPAPAGGKIVELGSSYPEFAPVPAGITIPAGATSGTFTIATSAVPFALDSSIEAVGAPPATLSLKTPGVRMTGLTLSAATASPGAAVTGTVTFSGSIPATPAPSTSGAIVKLTTSSPAVGVSPLLIVPVGASSATFGMSVQNVPVTTAVGVVASYDDTTLTKMLTIPGSAVSIASLTVNVNTLTGGQGGVGFVNLTGPAPAGHVLVTLSANDPAISLPANVLVSAGSTSGLFSFGAFPVTATTAARITAAFGSSTASTNVTVTPGVSVGVTSLTLNPTTVTAGATSTATVVLSGPAPAGGAVVQLSGMSPVTVPASVTVPAGATSATFTVGTTSTSSTTPATIYALLNTTWGAVLTVTPGASTPTLSAISLNPSSIVGGNTSQGTVTLTSAAPSGGKVVSLSSSDTVVAAVPSSVTVAAGSASATFSVSTNAVTASTPVTVSGTAGATRSATLSVTPPSAPAPAAPALVSPANGATLPIPIALDWADVTGAVSYRIQIDDSSGFTAPRVVEQIVPSSQFTATSLAAVQHWWRVRGINSAGAEGAWSAARSFTAQGDPSAPPPQTATLTVTASGRSGERVTSSPTGISVAVGSTGSASFTTGTAITLTVSNGRDAVWSGACSSGGNKTKSCTFTFNAATSVTANVQ